MRIFCTKIYFTLFDIEANLEKEGILCGGERRPSSSPRGDVAVGRRLPPFSKIKQRVSYMVEKTIKWAFCQGVMGVCALNSSEL